MPKRSKTQELLDFEIAFYERLLKEHPDFITALIPLGDAYTRRGWYQKGLEVDLKLVQLRGEEPTVWYNLACSYSLLQRIDQALFALRQAVVLGYDDFEHLAKDPDLVYVRLSPKFQGFLDSVTPQRSA